MHRPPLLGIVELRGDRTKWGVKWGSPLPLTQLRSSYPGGHEAAHAWRVGDGGENQGNQGGVQRLAVGQGGDGKLQGWPCPWPPPHGPATLGDDPEAGAGGGGTEAGMWARPSPGQERCGVSLHVPMEQGAGLTGEAGARALQVKDRGGLTLMCLMPGDRQGVGRRGGSMRVLGLVGGFSEEVMAQGGRLLWRGCGGGRGCYEETGV